MGRAFLVLSILAITLSLFAQKPAFAPNKPKEQVVATCTVSGRVVTAVEGSPLKSARVALIREHGVSTPRIYAANSDSDGHFTIKGVAPGRYSFFATRPGYVDQPYQSNETDSGAVLALQPGQQLTEVLFRLTMAAVITGHVNNQDGEAMVRVAVTALRRPTDEETSDEDFPQARKLEPIPVSAAQTDDRGQYRLFGLEPGEYYIKATDSFQPDMNMPLVSQDQVIREFMGSDYASVYFPGVPRLGEAQAVPVGAGAEVQVDFTMRQVKTVEISGRVIGPDGTPAAQASINLDEAENGDYGSQRYTFTDAKGNFSLKGIPPGSYVLATYQRLNGDKPYSARQKLEVGNDNIDSVVLALGGGINVSGRVTVAGPSSIRKDRIVVRLMPVGEAESWGNGVVKKDGTFEITGVKEGSYAVLVRGADEDLYTKSVRLGSDDVLANGLQVEKGSSAGTLEVVVSSGTAVLEGSVTKDDNPSIGARVRLTPDPRTPYNRMRSGSVNTDQNGHFSLQIAPGKYQVVARSRGTSGRAAASSDPQTVSVSEHDRKTIQLTIAPESRE